MFHFWFVNVSIVLTLCVSLPFPIQEGEILILGLPEPSEIKSLYKINTRTIFRCEVIKMSNYYHQFHYMISAGL